MPFEARTFPEVTAEYELYDALHEAMLGFIAERRYINADQTALGRYCRNEYLLEAGTEEQSTLNKYRGVLFSTFDDEHPKPSQKLPWIKRKMSHLLKDSIEGKLTP